MEFKPLVTLLAIVNPLAIVPFFIHYTQGSRAADRVRTISRASFSAFVVIATSALLGCASWSSSASRWPASRWAAACCC